MGRRLSELKEETLREMEEALTDYLDPMSIVSIAQHTELTSSEQHGRFMFLAGQLDILCTISNIRKARARELQEANDGLSSS